MHLSLDLFQLLGAESGLYIDVIVEAVRNGGADCQLGIRIETLHSLSQDMGSSVVEGTAALFTVEGEHFQGAVLIENSAQVAQFAVYLAGAGSLVQASAQTLDDLHHRDAIFKFLDRSVFECYMNHSVSSPFPIK